VHGGQDHAPARQVLGHQFGGDAAPRLIQRGQRFVQQPQGARGGDQARQRQPPPLPRRQLARLQIQQGRQLQPLDGRVHGGGRTAQPFDLKAQLLPRRALGLQTLVMAQQVKRCAPRRLGLDLAVRIVKNDRACIGPDKARHGAQQAGLARAIGPGQGRRLARRQGEGQVAEQPPLAARQA